MYIYFQHSNLLHEERMQDFRNEGEGRRKKLLGGPGACSPAIHFFNS